MSEYWLFRWLDKYNVTTLESAEARLNNSKAIEDLREAAGEAGDSLKAPAGDGRSILAGPGRDHTRDLSANTYYVWSG